MQEKYIKDLMSKVKDVQMTEEEYRYIVSKVSNKKLLVFGTGYDSDLWRYAVKDGMVKFLEHDDKWIPKNSNDIIKVNYSTDISQAKGLLDEYTSGNYDNLMMNLPEEILKTTWNCILVDSPPGWKVGTPGRMQSIYMASILAGKTTNVFVHDCDREVEDVFTNAMFSKTIKSLTKLRHVKK
jgi:uncharacterized protein (TIGR01627 family)